MTQISTIDTPMVKKKRNTYSTARHTRQVLRRDEDDGSRESEDGEGELHDCRSRDGNVYR